MSPIVGAATLEPLAAVLRTRGLAAVVAVPADDEPGDVHRSHATSIARAIRVGTPGPVVLVPHSGAGPLAGLVTDELPDVRGLVLMDAGWPAQDESRLEALASEIPPAAAELRELLADGRSWPTWTDDDLAADVARSDVRAAIVAGVRPRRRPYWEAPIPASSRWRQLPCGYLALSAGYEQPAGRAEAAGWPVRRLAAGHFAPATQPETVADALLELIEVLDLVG